MTLGMTPPLIEYAEDGSTTVHAIPFQFRGPAEILVSRRNPPGPAVILTLGSDYTVTGGGGGTGSITKPGGGTAGATLRIERVTSRAQPTAFVAHGSFPAADVEISLDRLAAVNEEQDSAIADVAARAIRVPVGETVAALPLAAARKGKFLGFDSLTGFLSLLTYQGLANLIAPLLNYSFQGVPGPGSDLATHLDSYLDASGDDTSAFATAILAAQAGTGVLKVSKGNYSVSQIVLPGGVRLVGAGKGLTLIQQRTGQPVGTPIVDITGSRGGISGVTLVGNIATDTSEFNHGVRVYATDVTGTIEDVEIDVRVQDIRGDGVLIGVNPAGYAAGYTARDIRWKVTGDNIYRNGWAVTGGDELECQHYAFTRVGIWTWDLEPDPTNGPIGRIRVCAGKASFVAVAGDNATACIEQCEVAALRMAATFVGRSVPAYPLLAGQAADGAAVWFRNVKSLRIGSLSATGYKAGGIEGISGNALPLQTVTIGDADIADCGKTGAATSFITPGVACEMRIGTLRYTGTGINNFVAVSRARFTIGTLIAQGVTGSYLFSDCDNFHIGRMEVSTNGAGAGVTVFQSTRNFSLEAAGSVAAPIVGNVLCGFGCTDGRLNDVHATMASNYVVSATRLLFTNRDFGGVRRGLDYYHSGASSPTFWTDETTGYPTADTVVANGGFFVGANKLVGPRAPALPAAATDLGTVIALANDLRNKLSISGGYHGMFA